MRHLCMFAIASLALAVVAAAQDFPNRQREAYPETIPAGVNIRVRTDQTIDARDHSDGRIYTGMVEEDVIASDGRTVIPLGARAELIVQNLPNNELVVDLESVAAQGVRYMVAARAYDASRRTRFGENRRTGEFVGGGAVFGAIVGAIAGGGKGAAIGGLAGGAAGAGAQALTRGQAVRIPAETILTFRLERPLEIGRGRYQQDNGYDRDGYHYHNDYYRREPRQ
jgi:hypothetical protein